jgi:amidohydrolase
MIKEGALANPKPGAIFGLHVMSAIQTGVIGYRAGGLMASADDFRIVVRGRQTHGALPWNGVDPIVVASQVVGALQTIVSRQVDLTKGAAIVTVGRIEGGTRFNIIPDEVVMRGTIRTLDPETREQVRAAVKRTAESTAAASGATATVEIGGIVQYPVTYNDAALTERMRPTLERIAGPGKAQVIPPTTTAEDFSEYQKLVPGLFVHLGVRRPGASIDDYAPNHSPRFRVDEDGLELGVRTLAHLALDWLQAPQAAAAAPGGGFGVSSTVITAATSATPSTSSDENAFVSQPGTNSSTAPNAPIM